MERKIFDIIEPWLATAIAAVVAIALAFIAHRIVFALLERLTLRTEGAVDASLVRHAKRPAWLVFTLFALVLALPGLDIPENIGASVGQILSLLLAAAFGWLAFSLTWTMNDVVAARYDITAADNLKAREIHTRVRLLQRILAMIIVIVTVSVILMAIPGIRQVGITLFASAGIAGIIAGFAARPVLSNLLAGIQLALSQPIRIDDVVIVEGEWGWVEEIRMTFVVVRVWDRRRLVVPLSYFIEKPFQNWTRQSADILGTVFLYTDYTVQVDRVREKLHRSLQGSDLWDGEVWGLQVTNATDRTVELRALMGARNSGDAWNLRCHVREGLIQFMQREYPQALPHLRAELVGETASPLSNRQTGSDATKDLSA
ncbi:MAG TPA: mechanosensitive ion channel domain-containing protein [Sulfuricaulis sp.]|nr:mechanosensitive ion channel domain-containing protein [Sulfuricaulis sp.]